MGEPAITEDSIRAMVDRFYEAVRADAELGPFFDGVIGEHWPEHMQRMYAFWSSVLLTTGRYKGSPMAAHMALPSFPQGFFERWLGLFEATVAGLFEPGPAEEILGKARRIAASLSLAIFYRPGPPGAVPRVA